MLRKRWLAIGLLHLPLLALAGPTPDDMAFLRSIADNPYDDLPRLVYADWLEERGCIHANAHAAFIRGHIELANAIQLNPDCRDALIHRFRPVLAEYRSSWETPYREAGFFSHRHERCNQIKLSRYKRSCADEKGGVAIVGFKHVLSAPPEKDLGAHLWVIHDALFGKTNVDDRKKLLDDVKQRVEAAAKTDASQTAAKRWESS